MSLASQMVRSMHFGDWLRGQFKRRRKGVECLVDKKGDNGTCSRCGYCCHAAPGALGPGDIEKIAEFLKIKPTELVDKYLTLHNQADDHALRPCPIRKDQESEAGGYLSDRGSWDTGACVFYEETNGKGSCRIHPVKPAQCATASKTDEVYWPPAIPVEDLKGFGFTTFDDPGYDDSYDMED